MIADLDDRRPLDSMSIELEGIVRAFGVRMGLWRNGAPVKGEWVGSG